MFTIIATDEHYCSNPLASFTEDDATIWKRILQDERRLNAEHLANKARKVRAIKKNTNK